MREAGCNRLVFSSSGAVYGNADSKALREDYPCAPINTYGASKWMIGGEVPHVVKPRRSGDPTYLVADPSAARATLNFRPTHSDLATIIRTAWAWHNKAHPLKTGGLLSRAGLGPVDQSGLICTLRNLTTPEPY
jgi:UDP-glucose 4-epimerase